jgi:oxygen-dependent protoporphyrinogen oxidase
VDGDLTVIGSNPNTGGVVVIGGGITGLAAAHRLMCLAPDMSITLVEVEQRLGGKILTERVDGFVIEGGPDSFLASKPRGAGLCEEVGLGYTLRGVTPRQKRAFILHQGHLHELPEGLTGLVPTRIAPLARSSLLSPLGKARVALDYVLPASRDDGDEPLGAFIRRRLGRQAWERLVEPLMAGIYAADGDLLSLAATFPQLCQAEREHGGLIRGVLANHGPSPAPSAALRSPFLSPAGGLGELVRALEQQLRAGGVAIHTGAPADRISLTDGSYLVEVGNGTRIRADAVIAATPAFVSAELLEHVDPVLAAELAGIPHASTAIVSFAFRRDEIPHPLDGHGYVVPRTEGSPILACTWSSRKWAGRAPADWELLRVFIGRAGDQQIDAQTADDKTLVALARQEVATRLGVTASPSLTRLHRWPRGMPQYVMGHLERVARIEHAIQAYPGLLLAGNAFHGVGLPDCIASGERAAEAALAHLQFRRANLGGNTLASAPILASSR